MMEASLKPVMVSVAISFSSSCCAQMAFTSEVSEANAPSAITKMVERLPLSTPHLMRSAISSMLQGASGTITYSAPQANAVCTAISPQLRPMTVIRLARSWESLVSRTRLMHSQAVFKAVSKPMVKSVYSKSLSMVPGMPMVGKPWSASALSPANVPSPPMPITPSTPSRCMFWITCFWHSGLWKSRQRAVIRKVPPRWILSLTDLRVMISKSSCVSRLRMSMPL